MPYTKVPVVHNFGIISHSQRLALQERLLRQSLHDNTLTKSTASKQPREVSEAFVDRYNNATSYDDREKYEGQANKLLERIKRRAGIQSGGEGAHVNIPLAWSELAQLAQCKGAIQEACLDALIISLDQAPFTDANIPTLFFLAETMLYWLRKDVIRHPYLRVAELKLLKMGYLVFLRLYYHHMAGNLQNKTEFKQRLFTYLEGLHECQDAYSPYPNALLCLRYVTEVGKIIMSDTNTEARGIIDGDHVQQQNVVTVKAMEDEAREKLINMGQLNTPRVGKKADDKQSVENETESKIKNERDNFLDITVGVPKRVSIGKVLHDRDDDETESRIVIDSELDTGVSTPGASRRSTGKFGENGFGVLNESAFTLESDLDGNLLSNVDFEGLGKDSLANIDALWDTYVGNIGQAEDSLDLNLDLGQGLGIGGINLGGTAESSYDGMSHLSKDAGLVSSLGVQGVPSGGGLASLGGQGVQGGPVGGLTVPLGGGPASLAQQKKVVTTGHVKVKQVDVETMNKNRDKFDDMVTKVEEDVTKKKPEKVKMTRDDFTKDLKNWSKMYADGNENQSNANDKTGQKDAATLSACVHDLSPSLWHALDVWRCTNQQGGGQDTAMVALLQCGVGISSENWVDTVTAMYILTESAKQSLQVLDVFQNLACGVVPPAPQHIKPPTTTTSYLTGISQMLAYKPGKNPTSGRSLCADRQPRCPSIDTNWRADHYTIHMSPLV